MIRQGHRGGRSRSLNRAVVSLIFLNGGVFREIRLDDVVLDVVRVDDREYHLLLSGGKQLERFLGPEPLFRFDGKQKFDLPVQAELHKPWQFLVVHEIVHESDFLDGFEGWKGRVLKLRSELLDQAVCGGRHFELL